MDRSTCHIRRTYHLKRERGSGDNRTVGLDLGPMTEWFRMSNPDIVVRNAKPTNSAATALRIAHT